jgi:DNA-binding SARP family transcriptional activator
MASTVAEAQPASQEAPGPGLRVYLLGGFRAECNGKPIGDSAWQRRSGLALVKLLALTPGHRLHRDRVYELLWPDAVPDLATDQLHKALYAARHALDPDLAPNARSSYLHLRRDIISLAADLLWTDADRFERLARDALKSGEQAAYEVALEAYNGELLPEDQYEDWGVARRETLANLELELLLGLGALLEHRGRHVEAVSWLRGALERDPTREDIYRRLMRLYVLAGSRHEALRQYRLCCQVLREEVDAEPEDETRALYEEILAGQITPARIHAPDSPHPPPLPAALGQIPAAPLVGRERALSFLVDRLEQAGKGRGSLVLVSGEAGVGKSRLVAELPREAQQRGALVLWGASYAEEGTLPYGPFVESLEEYVLGLPLDERHSLASRYPELVRLLPALRFATSPAARSENRSRLFAAITHLLTEIAGLNPVLLVLDDLHAADDASVQLLHRLGRAAGQRPWLLVGTYREEDIPSGSAIAQTTHPESQRSASHHVELLRLSRDESDRVVRSLLPDGSVPPTILADLYGLTLGNPLFLHELIQSLEDGGALTLTDQGWCASSGIGLSVPPGLRTLVDRRAARLGRNAQQTIGLAAVAGMESSFVLLREASTLAEMPLIDALDQALQARILEERGKGYAFRHPLFRQALYERLSSPRRTRLHATLASAIERTSPDEVEALAYHCGRTADREAAMRYLEAAGDSAAGAFAHDVAQAHYRDVLRRLVGMDCLADEARLREKLGAMLGILAHHDEALATLDQVAQSYEDARDDEGLARTLVAVARAHRERGTPEGGLARLQPLMERIEGGGAGSISTETRAALFLGLTHAWFGAGRYEESQTAAERAMDLARAAGNDSLLAEAVVPQSMALRSLGCDAEGLAALQEAVWLAESSSNLHALSVALHCLWDIHLVMGDTDRALAYQQRSLEVAERLGDPNMYAWVYGSFGATSLWTGRWEEARQNFLRTIELYTEIGASWNTPYPLGGLAGVELGTGNVDEAWQLFSEASAMATAHGDLQGVKNQEPGLAEIELLRGRHDAARDRLAALAGSLASYPYGLLGLSPILAEAHVALGEWEEAAVLLERYIPRAEQANRIMLVDLLRVNGMLLAAQERWEEAEAFLTRASDIGRAVHYPMGEGRGLLELGAMQARWGKPGLARQTIERALLVLTPLGARVHAERAAAILHSLPAPAG